MGKKNHNKKTVHKMHFKKMRKTLSEISSLRKSIDPEAKAKGSAAPSVAASPLVPLLKSPDIKRGITGNNPNSLPPKEVITVVNK